jgi:hypothetical protein
MLMLLVLFTFDMFFLPRSTADVTDPYFGQGIAQ